MEDGEGEAFLSREEWALQRTGEENEPAVADADRAEQREVVFGQTCPIETAVDVPVDRIKDYGKWHYSGGDQWERVHSANSPDRMVGANDCMWEAAGNGAL